MYNTHVHVYPVSFTNEYSTQIIHVLVRSKLRCTIYSPSLYDFIVSGLCPTLDPGRLSNSGGMAPC